MFDVSARLGDVAIVWFVFKFETASGVPSSGRFSRRNIATRSEIANSLSCSSACNDNPGGLCSGVSGNLIGLKPGDRLCRRFRLIRTGRSSSSYDVVVVVTGSTTLDGGGCGASE